MKYETFTIEITDDFNLEKIAGCGQCFRARAFPDGTYRFVTHNHAVYIRPLQGCIYEICCEEGTWESVWIGYFDLMRNYSRVRERAKTGAAFVQQAAQAGEGIRVLRQDPWEMLMTFIISQRKSIPAIAKSVECLCEKYGEPIKTPYETLHAFPLPQALCCAEKSDLDACALGYRTAYVQDAAARTASGQLDLAALAEKSDEELSEALRQVHGVGIKVANCVCLFGYGRTSCVPVDVWIERAIREDCRGEDPFTAFGEDAGIIQQYIFFYQRERAGRR